MISPDRIREQIGHVGEWIKHHKKVVIPIIPVLSLSPLIPGLVEGMNQNQVAVETGLKADYEATGGVNLERLKTSYLVTLRISSMSVPETTLVDNAWDRIKKESGCTPEQTMIFPGARPAFGALIVPQNLESRKRFLISVKC